MDSINQAVLQVISELDVDNILAVIVEQACELTHSASSAIYLMDSEIGALYLVTGCNLPEVAIGVIHQSEDSLVGHVMRSGQPSIATGYPDWTKDVGSPLPGLPECQKLVVPLSRDGIRLGVIEVCGDELDRQSLDCLAHFAAYAGPMVAHAYSFRAVQKAASQLAASNEMLRTVGNIAQAILDAGYRLERMATEVLDQAITSLGLGGGGVYLLGLWNVTEQERDHEGNGKLCLIAAQALPPEARAEANRFVQIASRDQSIPGRELVATCECASGNHAEPNCLLVSLPLLAGNLVGVLQVLTQPGKTLSQDDIEALLIVSNQLALGVQNARLFEEASAEHHRLQAILSSTDDIVLSTDREGCLVLCNAAAERAFGFSAADYLGRPLHEATANAALNTALDQVLRSLEQYQYRFEVPLADDYVLFASLSPVLGTSDGQVQGYVMVMQDISEFKLAERARASMILTASHELRNPVNLIMGALSLLGLYQDTMDDRMREALDLAQMGGQRVTALIEDLLDLERVEQRSDLTMAPCDMADVSRQSATEFKLLALDKNITFDVELPAEQPRVWGDGSRLRQAISNLLNNAFKYTPSGGRVTLRLRTEADRVLIDVCDTGPGIAPEVQARIFERFYRARNQPEGVEGTGLGLAIVHSIVEQHDGRVWVISEVGQGATFTMLLPKFPTPQHTQSNV